MKTKFTKIIFCLVAILLSSQISVFAFSNKTRGIRMGGSNLSTVASDNQTVIDKLVANNVNEVYIWVKDAGGGRTSPAKLNSFIPLAKTAGLKVTLMYTVNQDPPFLSRHNDAHVYKCPEQGVSYIPRIITSNNFVNLLYPGYMDSVAHEIGNLVRNYSPDGICLDDLRYSHFVYSFDQWSCARAVSLGCDTAQVFSYFRTNYAYYATQSHFIDLYTTGEGGDPDVVKWVDMRKGVITEYIQAIKDTITAIKSGIQLSASYATDAGIDAQASHVHYGQDYALHSQYLDVINPYISSASQNISTLTAAAVTQGGANCQIISRILTGSDASTLTTNITNAVSNDSYGVVLEKYDNLTTAMWDALKISFAGLITGKKEIISEAFMLGQNYPNPFKFSTEITFHINKNGVVSLNVYDALGKKISVLVNQQMLPGTYKVSFDGKNLPNGVYFYQLETNDGVSAVKKMILQK